MRSAWLLPLLALLACQSPPEVRHRVQPSFYHWQSTLALTELETARMDSLATAFTTDYHTATMIPVFAYGPGAEAFSGIYENTAIFDKIRAVMRW